MCACVCTRTRAHYSKLKETEDIIQLTLEQCEASIPGQLKIHVQLLTSQLPLDICRVLVLGPLADTNIHDGQVTYLKWHRTMHRGSLNTTDSQPQENTVLICG